MGKVQSLEGSRLLYGDLRRRISDLSFMFSLKMGDVITGAPGSQAQAYITGTPPDLFLNLVIPQGIDGEKGETGDKGEQGDPGVAATVTVGQVITGEPGTDAKVINTGTTTNAVLNFVIPKGKSGTTTVETYVHDQTVASDRWVIAHYLDKFPSVTVVDSANTVIVCGIEYVNKNICVVNTKYPFKGKAYLN